MASRSEIVCDACSDDGIDDTEAQTIYLGFSNTWWQLDLCTEHEVALLSDLEALLDSVGSPVSGPPLDV